jgi:hypothetical protein
MQRSVRNYCQGGRPPVGLFANFSDYLSEEEKTFEYNFGTCKYERALSHGRFCMQIETVVVVPLIILFAVVGRFGLQTMEGVTFPTIFFNTCFHKSRSVSIGIQSDRG